MTDGSGNWGRVVPRAIAIPALTGLTGFLISMWMSFGFAHLLETPIVLWGFGALISAFLLLIAIFRLTPTYRQLDELRKTAAKAQRLAEANQQDAEDAQGAAEERQRQAEKGQRTARHALQNAMDVLVRHHLNHLRAWTPDARISVYSVEGEEFVLVSRRSKNPTHERRGRPAYSLARGVVGEAWENGTAQRFSESTIRDEWERELVASGDFTESEVRELTMMARTIHATRLDAQDGEPVGMLVLESTRQRRFKDGILKSMLGATAHAMSLILTNSHSEFPRVIERSHEREGSTSETPVLIEAAWKSSKVKSRDAGVVHPSEDLSVSLTAQRNDETPLTRP